MLSTQQILSYREKKGLTLGMWVEALPSIPGTPSVLQGPCTVFNIPIPATAWTVASTQLTAKKKKEGGILMETSCLRGRAWQMCSPGRGHPGGAGAGRVGSEGPWSPASKMNTAAGNCSPRGMGSNLPTGLGRAGLGQGLGSHGIRHDAAATSGASGESLRALLIV